MTLRALVFDVDGTLAETERDGHRVAFNQAFEAEGLAWRWDVERYATLLRTAGGYERLLADMATRRDAPTLPADRETLARRLHRIKDGRYRALVATGGIALRPGVARVFDECERAGIALAIATTTGRGNVEALLAATLGPDAMDRFAAVVCAEDAPAKKPDPLAYRLVLERLGLAADAVLAVEDSRNGVDAAHAVCIPVVVTRSIYFADDVFDGCAAICDDLDAPLAGPGFSAPRVDVAALRRLREHASA